MVLSRDLALTLGGILTIVKTTVFEMEELSESEQSTLESLITSNEEEKV